MTLLLEIERGNTACFKCTLCHPVIQCHTHHPGTSFCPQQLIHCDDRDPDEDEHTHAPAQSHAPVWVLDLSIGGGLKGYTRPDQDHLDSEHNIRSYSDIGHPHVRVRVQRWTKKNPPKTSHTMYKCMETTNVTRSTTGPCTGIFCHLLFFHQPRSTLYYLSKWIEYFLITFCTFISIHITYKTN